MDAVLNHTAHIWCELKDGGNNKLRDLHCTVLTLFALKLAVILRMNDEQELPLSAQQIVAVLFSDHIHGDDRGHGDEMFSLWMVFPEETRYRASHQLQTLIHRSYPEYFDGATFVNNVHVLFIPTDTGGSGYMEDEDVPRGVLTANVHLFNVAVVQNMTAKQVRSVVVVVTHEL